MGFNICIVGVPQKENRKNESKKIIKNYDANKGNIVSKKFPELFIQNKLLFTTSGIILIR